MKGKYAARATLRREDSDVRSEIEAYQHNVKRLTAENEKLKADLAAGRAQCKQEVRRLKAQLDEGLSPELLAIREELERQRERADTAISARRNTKEKHERLFEFTAALLHDVTGCTGLEATEAMLAALGHESQMDFGTHHNTAAPTATTLQRVRGFRSSAKVIEHLNAVCRQAALRPPKNIFKAARRAQ